MRYFWLTIVLTFASAAFGMPTCDRYKFQDCNPSLNLTSCEKDLIKDYSEGLFIPLNRHLRKIEVDTSCSELADILSSILKKIPAMGNLKLFRGTKLHSTLKDIKVGECFSDLAFVSTSRTELVATGFSGYNSDSTLMIINSRSGRDISEYSYASGESEVLLLPNTVLKLKDRNFGSSIQEKLFFDEVNPEDCSVIKH